MSFTATIKSELCRLDQQRPCCLQAELAGFIATNGNLQLSGQRRVKLNIATEHAYVARRLYKLLRKFNMVPSVMARKKERLRKNITYLVQVKQTSHVSTIVQQLGLVDEKMKGNLSRCCQRSYIRGCFLAGGSVSSPEINGYHLEIASELLSHAQQVSKLLYKLGIKSGIVPRKQQHVVYVKSSEDIAEVLSIMGSNQGRLAFENARIYKDMRNRVNRLVNCETANVNKTVNAAQSQIAAIRQLSAEGRLEKLSSGLRQAARLRLDYPDATLVELGQLSHPPLSKSAVNYRLRKLQQLVRQQPDKM